MIKKLFVSDLDGTLLDNNARISSFTEKIVNMLAEDGMFFTFATARSVYSAKPITSNLKINVPCILMNGVSVYDISENRYIKNEFIPESVSRCIINSFEKHNVKCFMYKIRGDVLTAYFTEITPGVMQQFAEERKNRYGKPFVKCTVFEPDPEIVYFTASDEYERLFPVKEEVSHIDGADFAFYRDTYTGKWYLEVFSEKASKANGVRFLRENYGFEYVTAFGDNQNDLPMFSESDCKIAVGNADIRVKEMADFIADTNVCDGVAKWLFANYR
ncbi:MAG: HAD family hydrolase [Porcipelethomonas sp.]